MTPKLSAEQRAALVGHDGPLPIEDDQSQRVFFLLDKSTLDRLQREADRAAISEGIANMEAGHVLTLEELDARIRSKLGFGSSAWPIE